MSTVALPDISARHSILALGPKGPQANMELPGRCAWLRDGGHVKISKYAVDLIKQGFSAKIHQKKRNFIAEIKYFVRLVITKTNVKYILQFPIED